jgi:hypothetical protein
MAEQASSDHCRYVAGAAEAACEIRPEMQIVTESNSHALD